MIPLHAVYFSKAQKEKNVFTSRINVSYLKRLLGERARISEGGVGLVGRRGGADLVQLAAHQLTLLLRPLEDRRPSACITAITVLMPACSDPDPDLAIKIGMDKTLHFESLNEQDLYLKATVLEQCLLYEKMSTTVCLQSCTCQPRSSSPKIFFL